uniref:N-acylglucosamine-6-phosphate 2-epimerase n=1 Tax=viral metagenome TaxID=1070528 RepID=A0A6M3IR46_9ZZZZ
MEFGNRLIVSCQDRTDWTIPMAVHGGAGGLRVNGVDDVKFARSVRENIPLVACWKKDIPGVQVRITPQIDMMQGLFRAGATFVAFDATQRRRLHSVASMVAAARRWSGMCVADVSTVDEGCDAWEAGADIVATTLFPVFDLEAIRRLATCGIRVMAEGNIRTPEQARQCLEAGADLVCVGSAITRPHEVTKWFLAALSKGM